MYTIKDLDYMSAIELGAFLVYLQDKGLENTKLGKEAFKRAEWRQIVEYISEGA